MYGGSCEKGGPEEDKECAKVSEGVPPLPAPRRIKLPPAKALVIDFTVDPQRDPADVVGNQGKFPQFRGADGVGSPPVTTRKRSSTADGEALLGRLWALSGGTNCADCDAPNPSWASTNTGALVCIKCAGVHRFIGASYSQPLSVKLDAWSESQINIMLRGNSNVNAELEQILQPDQKPTPQSSREYLEKFIWSKYARRAFVGGGTGQLESMPVSHGQTRSESTDGQRMSAGVLILRVLQAHGLAVRSGSVYVTCWTDVAAPDQRGITRLVSGVQNPSWNEVIPLNVATQLVPQSGQNIHSVGLAPGTSVLHVEVFATTASGSKQQAAVRARDRLLGVGYGHWQTRHPVTTVVLPSEQLALLRKPRPKGPRQWGCCSSLPGHHALDGPRRPSFLGPGYTKSTPEGEGGGSAVSAAHEQALALDSGARELREGFLLDLAALAHGKPQTMWMALLAPPESDTGLNGGELLLEATFEPLTC